MAVEFPFTAIIAELVRLLGSGAMKRPKPRRW
jgi:hypothetical protein